jgi:multiple sugar transport system permease protein
MRKVRSAALGYALLAPSLFGVVTFLLLPMLVVLWLSVHRWDLLGPVTYVGLDNGARCSPTRRLRRRCW